MIERHYYALAELEEARVVRLDEAAFIRAFMGPQAEAVLRYQDYELQIHAVLLPERFNLPMVVCKLMGRPGQPDYAGFGLGSTLDVAVSRAVTEAFQCIATFVSGAREDMAGNSRGWRGGVRLAKVTRVSWSVGRV